MTPLDRIRWMAAVASLDLPPTCYRLAAHLAMYAVNKGQCWSSRPTLAKAAGIYESRLPMAFRALESVGAIRRGAMTGPPGRRTYIWSMVMPPNGPVEPPTDCGPPTETVPGPQPVIIPPTNSGPQGWERKGVNTLAVEASPPSLYEPVPSKRDPRVEQAAINERQDFEQLWEEYGRRGSKKKAWEQWRKLSDEQQGKAWDHIPKYVKSTPDIRYRLHMERYLRDHAFMNEIAWPPGTLFDQHGNPCPYERGTDEWMNWCVLTGNYTT